MNEMQVFSYEGKGVRTVRRDGELWGVLKDVCDVLEFCNPSMIAERLDDHEQAKYGLA
jgi:prophage antirepressor-like protein